MNLRNGQISVREVLHNPRARQILQKEIPGVLNHPMIGLAQGMSLNTVIGIAAKRIPKMKINSIISQLKSL